MFEKALKYLLDGYFIPQAAKDLSMEMHEAEERGYMITAEEDWLWELLTIRILQKDGK